MHDSIQGYVPNHNNRIVKAPIPHIIYLSAPLNVNFSIRLLIAIKGKRPAICSVSGFYRISPID